MATLCRLLEVSRSGYYDWVARAPSQKAQEDEALKASIKKHFDDQRGRAGMRTIKRQLHRVEEVDVSRRRIGRLMQELGLRCITRKKFKATTNSRHNLPVADNLLNRQFEVATPNQAYVGDITYVWTQEGWLYLSILIDLFSRAVVGWSTSERMQANLVCDTLRMAIAQRQPESGLIVHSDRGVQYASNAFQALLDEHGYQCSMSRKGNCWDNAVEESFFHSLKMELIYQRRFETREEAKQAIFEYIEVFYNRKRCHSTIDYLSPLDYEAEYQKAA